MPIEQIQHFLYEYQRLFIVIGTILFGETVIITASFASEAIGISPVQVFLLSFLGTMLSDFGWFLLGKYFYETVMKRKWVQDKFPKKRKMISDIVENPKRTLVYYKFLYGFRILTILFVASGKIASKNFIIFNAIGASIWLTFMVGIGWLAGKGVINLVPYLHRIEYFIPILVIFLITMRLTAQWIGKKLAAE